MQVGYLRRLFESRPWQRLLPDQGAIVGDRGVGASALRAARAADGSFLFVYSPYGRPFQVDLARLSGMVEASWFDPQSGVAVPVGSFPNAGARPFDPPGDEGRGNDWVLVLDDAGRGFGAPGAAP